jgi:molybdopterin synthase sulfur carrier subunit
MLARHLDSQSELTVNARSLDGLLSELDRRYPGFRDSVCDEAGKVRVYVNLFVNGEMVAPRPDALKAPLSDGDEVYILASVAGGAR